MDFVELTLKQVPFEVYSSASDYCLRVYDCSLEDFLCGCIGVLAENSSK